MFWFAIVGVLVTALYMGNLNAAPTDWSKVATILNNSGSAPVPTTIPGLSVIQLQSVGPKAIEFCKTEQAKGKAILIPKNLLKGVANTGDQILSVDPIWVESATASGNLVLLPRI